MTKKITDNDKWIKEHFEELVTKFGGKYPYILVAGGIAFPIKAGADIAKIEADITKKHGKPTGMPIPQPRDFLSILILWPQ